MSATDEIILHRDGHLIARFQNVLIQVRSAMMTEHVLDRIESVARLLRVATPGLVGAVVIVEEGADLAPGPLRARQTAVVRELLADRRTYFVAVVVGESVVTRAVRTFMRLALMGVPRLSTAATPEAGVGWLCDQLGRPPKAELLAAVERARATVSAARAR